MKDNRPSRIALDVSRHCVATAARQAYEKELRACFTANPDQLPRLEEAVENLKYFLEQADFDRLRSDFKELSGGATAKVELEAHPGPAPVLLLHGKPLAWD